MRPAKPWRRHPAPPWYGPGAPSSHGLELEHDDGAHSVVVVEKCRRSEPGEPREVWVAFWYPAGAYGLGPHIITTLFATRRLEAAKMLVELWTTTSARPDEADPAEERRREPSWVRA